MSIISVPLEKAYRLLNHGATTIISAQSDEIKNAMSASWVCPLDYDKVSAVINSGAYTRKLIEKSGYFAVQLPVFTQNTCFFIWAKTVVFLCRTKWTVLRCFIKTALMCH